MARSYNFIFSKLVRDENDLIGLIAYGIYKQHKIQFIESFKRSHGDVEPSDDDCLTFAPSTCTPTALQQYRDTAEALLQEITLSAAREEINDFENNMLRTYRQEIAESVKANTQGWWASFGASVAGAFVFAILVYIGFLLGSTSESKTVESFTKAIEAVKTTNSPDSAAIIQE